MFLILTFHVDLSRAQYIVNGAPVCKAVCDQDVPRIESAGANGAFIKWFDLRDGTVDIYVQRIGPDGYPYWTENGVSICDAPGIKGGPAMCADGGCGAIVVWQDRRVDEGGVYAQRITSSGDTLWAKNGVPICTAPGLQSHTPVVPDGEGGAIIAWWDIRSGTIQENDIYAARIDGDGYRIATQLQHMASYIGEFYVTLEWTLSDPEPRITFVVVRHDVTRSETVVIDEPEIVRDGTRYIFEDTGLSPGTTDRCRVDSEDGGGRRLLFETDHLTVPEMAVTLYQNHPDPFNPSTAIRFHLPDAQRVILTIHDISGKRIATLEDEFRVKGFHVVDWNGTSDDGAPVESGVYFFRLNAGKTLLSRKMILLR